MATWITLTELDGDELVVQVESIVAMQRQSVRSGVNFGGRRISLGGAWTAGSGTSPPIPGVTNVDYTAIWLDSNTREASIRVDETPDEIRSKSGQPWMSIPD